MNNSHEREKCLNVGVYRIFFIIFWRLSTCLGAIIGIFSQINAGDDESREHAVNFLKENVLELIPKVFDPNPDAVEALSEEIHKVCCFSCMHAFLCCNTKYFHQECTLCSGTIVLSSGRNLNWLELTKEAFPLRHSLFTTGHVGLFILKLNWRTIQRLNSRYSTEKVS